MPKTMWPLGLDEDPFQMASDGRFDLPLVMRHELGIHQTGNVCVCLEQETDLPAIQFLA